MLNGPEPEVFVEPAGVKCPDVDREHVELQRSTGSDLVEKATGEAVAPASRDDVESANAAGSAKALLLLHVQSGNGDHGVAHEVSEEDLARRFESVDSGTEVGQQAIHPIQTDVMDIEAVKRQYGDRVAIVGNIFMSDLVYKDPAEIESQVRWCLKTIGAGGGYIISSSNSLTDNMKPENVIAMLDAVNEEG